MALLVLALAVSAVAPASAAALTPATTLFKPGTTPALGPPNYSTVLPAYFAPANIVGGPMASAYVPLTPSITGVLTSTVYRNPATGFLGFRYRFTSTGVSDLIRASMGGFAWTGVTVFNAGADGTGSSTAGTVAPVWTNGDPHFLLRDPVISGEGLTIQWRALNQGTALRAGNSSSSIFYETNWETFQVVGVGLLDSGAVSTAQAFAPGPIRPSLDLEKHTNGQDADAVPGPSIPVGAPVLWEFIVTNTGNVTLTNIAVTDDVLGPIGVIASLAPGASQTLTANGVAVAGQYANVGSASGTPPVGNPVTDSDPSHYFGSNPSLDIEKHTNGQDADAAPGPSIPVGAPVLWEFIVTNTGNVTLTNIAVTDDVLGPIGVIASLAPGASQTLTANGVAVAGQYANVGSASGTPPVGNPVTDSDPSHYFGSNPSLDLEKHTNGQDADAAPGPLVPVGAPVLWEFIVTNTGNVTLTNIAVTDNVLGPIGVIASLAPGASQTLTANGVAVAGQYANVGTATGTPPVGPAVSDSDPSHYFGSNPSLDIEKHTNGQDADAAPGPSIPVGAPVLWEFIVTNTGNVTLTNIAVTDDVLGPIGVIASLAPGASQTLSANGVAVAGQYANVGSASGTPPVGNPVTDSDPSHYFGSNPSLDLEKHTNGQDADAAPGPSIPVGAPVLWEFIVTNTGNVTLTNIAVTDDVLGPIGVIASLAPGASQTLTANGVAVAGQYANVGSASGTPPVGNPVTDSDPSHYLGTSPQGQGQITIEKSGGELLGNSRTIGFWKNNILKHIQGKKNGFQVSYANLVAWLGVVQGFYRPDPFVLGATDAQRLQNAYNVLNYSGSNMAAKTRRQLIACELNLLSGTFALADVAAHTALCKLAEDALNTVGADLAFIHNLLDVANNVGENGGYPGPLICGSTVLYTISVTATGLAAPTAIQVKDCLDTALVFLVADGGGTYSAGTHCVKWTPSLPTGSSVTVLHIWVSLITLPQGDAAPCPAGWTSSNVLELPVATKQGQVLAEGLKNSACFKKE